MSGARNSDKDLYPGIFRAALEIALDNGGINRNRSVEQHERDFSKFIAKQPEGMLGPIDAWLRKLTEEELSVVCCGEESEMKAALAGSPPFTDQLLAQYFDEVC